MYPQTLPWWKSRVIVGALVSAIFKLLFAVLVLFDVDVPVGDDDLQPVIDAIVLLVSLGGDFVAARARVTQKAAPAITAKGNDYA